MKKELLKILADNVNLKGIAYDMIDEVLEEALKKVVADSSNPFDDMLMASVYPILEKEVKKLIDEHLDLDKLLKLDEVAE